MRNINRRQNIGTMRKQRPAQLPRQTRRRVSLPTGLAPVEAEIGSKAGGAPCVQSSSPTPQGRGGRRRQSHSAASPLDVPGIVTHARTADILAAIKESRTDKPRQ